MKEGGRANMDRFVVRCPRGPQSPRRAAPAPRVCRQVTLESLKAGHRWEGAGARPGLPRTGGAALRERRFCTEIFAALRRDPNRGVVVQCRGLCCLARGAVGYNSAGHTTRGQPASRSISSWLSSPSSKENLSVHFMDVVCETCTRAEPLLVTCL